MGLIIPPVHIFAEVGSWVMYARGWIVEANDEEFEGVEDGGVITTQANRVVIHASEGGAAWNHDTNEKLVLQPRHFYTLTDVGVQENKEWTAT